MAVHLSTIKHIVSMAVKSFLTLRSLLLLLALYNFLLVWSESGGTISCMICPWYTDWSFANEPSFILLAACALQFRRRLGYFVAVVASGVVVVRGLSFSLEIFRQEFWGPFDIPTTLYRNPFLYLPVQYVFALVIFVTAAYLQIRISRRQQGPKQTD